MAATLTIEEQLHLVDRLADAQWHSGEALAAELGISRAALSKRMAQLREWGLDLESRQGLGYCLRHPLERLDAQTIAQGCGQRWRVAVEPVIDSTNRALAETASAQDPQALLAEMQTAGRGRRGRSWQSPFGSNLYASMAWTFASWPAQLTTLPLIVGIITARAITEVAGELPGLRLKWPNDLWIDGRKLGGILIEPRGEATGQCRVIIGIGLNIGMQGDPEQAITQPWISLDQAAAQRVSRNALASALLRGLHAMLVEFASSQFAGWAEDWNRLDATRGQMVRLSGEKTLEGTARGVSEHGALLVETDDGLQAIYSGDVSLRLA